MHKYRIQIMVVALSAIFVCAPLAMADSHGKFPGRGSAEDYNRSCPISNEGNRLEEAGKYEEAIKLYEKAISIYPYDSMRFLGLGHALRKSGKYDESIKALNRALELEPRFTGAMIALGMAYEKMRRLPEAEKCYRTAIQWKPTSYEAVADLGDILRQQGRFDEARKYLLRADTLPDPLKDPNEIKEALKRCANHDDSPLDSGAKPAPPNKPKESDNWDEMYK